MGKEIIRPVVEAVGEAVKDDNQLTPEDLEKREVDRAVRQIRGLWNPDLEQTPDVMQDRNDVLHTILMVSTAHNIDHQEIADWIYGPGKVNIESMLSELWFDKTATYQEFADAPFPMKKLFFRPTPMHVIDANFFKGPSSGKLLVQINVYTREYGDLRPTHGFLIPQEVANFEEAMKTVEETIQELRNPEKIEPSLRQLAKKCLEGSDEEFSDILRSHQDNKFLRALVLEALATFNPRSDSRWGRVRRIIREVGGAGLLERFNAIALL